jgi:cell division protease FtsH
MFMGRDIATERDFSEETASMIDDEVSQLVAVAYQRAKDVLVGNKDVLDKLANMLVERETVDSEELSDLLISNDVKMAPIA